MKVQIGLYIAGRRYRQEKALEPGGSGGDDDGQDPGPTDHHGNTVTAQTTMMTAAMTSTSLSAVKGTIIAAGIPNRQAQREG